MTVGDKRDGQSCARTLGVLSPANLALMRTRFIPQGEFNSIADADLVVDDAEIITDDLLAHSEPVRYFPILKPLGDQLNHVLLTRTRLAIVLADKYPSLRHIRWEGDDGESGR